MTECGLILPELEISIRILLHSLTSWSYTGDIGTRGDQQMENKSELVEFAADIVAAYVGNNSVPVTELPSLINDVIRALNGAVSTGAEAVLEEARPAVPIKKSVTPDYIICLEDGKKFKSLKRHLRTTCSARSQISVFSAENC